MTVDPGQTTPPEHRGDTDPTDVPRVRGLISIVPIGHALVLTGAVSATFLAAFATGVRTAGLWDGTRGRVAEHWPWLLGVLALTLAVGTLSRLVRIDGRGAAFLGGRVDLRRIDFAGGRLDLDAPAAVDRPPLLDDFGPDRPIGLRLP